MRHVIPCGLLVLLGLAGGQQTASAAEEVAEQFDCANCHTERLTEFRRRRAVALVEHEPEPELPSGRQPEVSTPAMCWSCHDGYVQDSRPLWTNEFHGHPVGVEPQGVVASAAALADGVLPLNEDGKVYCGSCHSAHFDSEAEFEAPPFMRVGLKSGNLCLECHVDKSAVAESPHARQSRRRRGNIADFSARGVCTRCHVAHNPSGPLMWAQEMGDGQLPVEPLCRSCHSSDVPVAAHPDSVTAWAADVRAPFVADDGPEMPVFDEGWSHDSFGNIGCGTCHDPHRQYVAGSGSGRAGKFLRRDRTAGFLCADCHGESSIYRYQFFHSGRAHGTH